MHIDSGCGCGIILSPTNRDVMSHCYPASLIMCLNSPQRSRFRCTFITSAVPRRHHRRRLLKYSPSPTPTLPSTIFKLSDDTLQITLKPPPDSLQQFEMRVNQFVEYSRDVFDDLRTIVTVDNNNGGGVVISCKRSTAEYLLAMILSSLVIIVTFRALFKFRNNGGEKLIYKRDRSLGGREVVVGKRERDLATRPKLTALSGKSSDFFNQKERNTTRLWGRRKEQLPQWWPQVLNLGSHVETNNKEEYHRMANQLIQEIMDRKMKGEDILTSDIVQLRHICKSSGVRAIINTENARDSLYRASVNFVLSYCESISNISTPVQINGEDARDFIAGLADNIGLENSRAARMVCAAVAAHTRSRILQAWALEVQNKHSEALVELFKVCLIHRIFPPEESSPEMEMVAQGLEKSLSVEQRESIFNSFSDVCGDDMHRSVAEALGLSTLQMSGKGPPITKPVWGVVKDQ